MLSMTTFIGGEESANAAATCRISCEASSGRITQAALDAGADPRRIGSSRTSLRPASMSSAIIGQLIQRVRPSQFSMSLARALTQQLCSCGCAAYD